LARWRAAQASSDVQATALDYGCGLGRLISGARQLGVPFWGVENYHERADTEAYAAENTEQSARPFIKRLGSGGTIPFDDEYFAFVSSDEVIEHVRDIATMAGELARVTRRGGMQVHLFPTSSILV